MRPSASAKGSRLEGIGVRVFSQRVVSVFITFSFAVSAFGQQNQKLRDRDPDLAGSKKVLEDLQQANFHSGAFYWMSRIRLSDAGFTETAYVPTGDQDNSVSLSIEAPNRFYFRPHRKTVFTVDVVPGYSFFGNEDSNQFNYSARADAHFLFNHLYLDFYTANLDQLRAHVSDINRLATVKETNHGLAGEVKYSSRTSALFNVSYGETEYPPERYQPLLQNGEPIPIDLLDRIQRNGRVSLHHKTFPLTSLFIAAEGSTYAFRRATFKDSRRIWYGGGFLWDGGRSSVRAEAGPLKLEFDDPTQHDYTGVAGQLALSRASGRWGFSASLDRDLGFAITEGNNYFVATSISAGITRQATRRLTLRTNAVWERDEYDVTIPTLNRQREDEISFYSVGASYGFTRVRFGGDIGWYERQSTIFEEDDSGIRYAVHLSITP